MWYFVCGARSHLKRPCFWLILIGPNLKPDRLVVARANPLASVRSYLECQLKTLAPLNWLWRATREKIYHPSFVSYLHRYWWRSRLAETAVSGSLASLFFFCFIPTWQFFANSTASWPVICRKEIEAAPRHFGGPSISTGRGWKRANVDNQRSFNATIKSIKDF